MSDLEVFSKMLNKKEKNVVTLSERDYLSKRGIDYDEITKVGVSTSHDFITYWVFDSKTGDLIEVVEERVNTDEKSFIRFLESADVEYSVSNGTIDMDGCISETDDVEVQQTGVKFLFGKSSQSFLGVVKDIKFHSSNSKGCTCDCHS